MVDSVTLKFDSFENYNQFLNHKDDSKSSSLTIKTTSRILPALRRRTHSQLKGIQKYQRRTLDRTLNLQIHRLPHLQPRSPQTQTTTKVFTISSRTSKVFKQMSEFVNTRTSVQCRSQNQRLFRKFKNFRNIVAVFKAEYGRERFEVDYEEATKLPGIKFKTEL